MPQIEEIEVVPLYERFDDRRTQQALGQISLLLRQSFRQEIPGLQIDIGDSLKGLLTAIELVEDEFNDCFGNTLQQMGLPRFALWQENLMPAFARRNLHNRSATLGPHEDIGSIGPAVHYELMHQGDFPVQLAFVDHVLPELDEKRDMAGLDYDGKETLRDHADTVWEGEVREGRLTIFSQGGDYLGLKPSAHFFDRRDMGWRGSHTRYTCSDLTLYDWTDFPYDDFVENRSYARMRNAYDRWREISEVLPEYKHAMSDQEFTEKQARARCVMKELAPYARLYLPSQDRRPRPDTTEDDLDHNSKYSSDPHDPEFDFSYAAYCKNHDSPASVRRPITDFLLQRVK